MTQTIQSRGKNIVVETFTGKVAEVTKNFETKVSGGGGGGHTFNGSGYTNPVRISSKTIVHDQFFLVNKEGEEASFQLQDFNVAIRKDNIVTVFWAYTENKRNTSQYIGVMNNTTKEKTLDNKIISTIAFWGSETQSATGCMIYILLFLAVMLVLGLLFFHPVVALLLGTGLIVGWIMYTNKIKETARTFISQVKIPTTELW